MTITFLGTNGWYTDENGDTPCILIETNDHYIILDAGNGFSKLDNHITKDKPVSLFISHFHIDHVSGLHTLGKYTFKGGLDVYVGENRKKDFETLVHPPYTVGFENDSQNINQLRMDVRVHELTNEKTEHVPFPVTAIPQFHGYTDHGYRLELEGKIIAYSGDCGISENSYPLAKDADLLIHECSYTEPKENDSWGHVDPTQAATLAKNVGVKQLILTHFDPTQYKTLDDRKIAEEKAKKIFKNTIAASDGYTLTL